MPQKPTTSSLSQIVPAPAHLAYAAFKDDDGSAVVHEVAFFALRVGELVGLIVLPTDGASACEDSDNFVGYASTATAAAGLVKVE